MKPKTLETRWPRLDRVAVALIDDPVRPARRTLDESKLASLTDSVRALGILQPLSLVQCGERYEVAAGARRLLAARAVGLKEVPAAIYAEGYTELVAARLHENAEREDLGPADEALYLFELLEHEAGGDVDTLARMSRRSRDYIDNRLALLAGDVEVFAALGRTDIGVGVARELNLVRNGSDRAVFLDSCVRGGATVGVVAGWRQKSNAVLQAVVPPNETDSGASAVEADHQAPATPSVEAMRCLFCGSEDYPHSMTLNFAHELCLKFFRDRYPAK